MSASNQGSVIITTRDETLVEDRFGDCAIGVATFDDHTGTDFLLDLLSTTGIHNEIGQREAATTLVKMLGGHPLAISSMANHMCESHVSIPEFVSMYEENTKDFHELDELGTIWKLPFKTMDSKSRALLAMLCFLDVDCISRDLFTGGLSFCADKLGYDSR